MERNRAEGNAAEENTAVRNAAEGNAAEGNAAEGNVQLGFIGSLGLFWFPGIFSRTRVIQRLGFHSADTSVLRHLPRLRLFLQAVC